MLREASWKVPTIAYGQVFVMLLPFLSSRPILEPHSCAWRIERFSLTDCITRNGIGWINSNVAALYVNTTNACVCSTYDSILFYFKVLSVFHVVHFSSFVSFLAGIVVGFSSLYTAVLHLCLTSRYSTAQITGKSNHKRIHRFQCYSLRSSTFITVVKYYVH